MSWYDIPTQKQIDYIEDINDHVSGIPKFLGSTRKEASEYIDKYSNFMHELDEIEFEGIHGDWGDR